LNPATYIARPGFHDNPIPEAALVEAARSNPHFTVLDLPQPGGAVQHEVVLSNDPHAKLFLSAGLVVAHDTSRALAKAMFELAPALKGAVYSARLRRYHSLSDWERRTRRHLERNRHGVGRHFNKRLLIGLAVLAIVAVSVWIGLSQGMAD
jgi:hypothetical protein